MVPTEDTVSLAEAFARMEGFYSPGSRAARNHNPGNMNWGDFARQHGATHCEVMPNGTTGRFAVFPSDEVGFAALNALLKSASYAGKTVAQAVARYAPNGDGNDSEVYTRNVCAWRGCHPDDLVSEVLA